MSSQLSNLSATLPPVGTAAVVPGSAGGVGAGPPLPPALPDAPTVPSQPTAAGGGANATADDPQVVALLQQVISIVKQLLAVGSAQLGAAGLSGGGPSVTPEVVAPESLRAAAVGDGGGLGGGASWSGAYTLEAVSSGVTGGGAAATGAPVGALADASLGGSGGSGWYIVDSPGMPANAALSGGGAAAAPAVHPGTAAAAASPRLDQRRISGTPQAGGVIDAVLRAATATAAPSRSGGIWTTLADGNGAKMQAHVHGSWSAHPDRIAEGIQRGLLHAHLHGDGTVHLHDVA